MGIFLNESRKSQRVQVALLALGMAVAACLLTGSSVVSATGAVERSLPEALFPAGPSRQVQLKLDAALQELTQRDDFSGVVLIARNEQILFQGAYGLASRDYGVPNTLDTQFNLASAGKMFTSVSIAQLAQQGKLRFEDPIGKYLGTDWISADIGKKVTIAQLLTHTSGLSDYLLTVVQSHKPLYKELADLKPLIAKTTLVGEPGKEWDYCNTNFVLLGAIIEKVSGKSYLDYLQQNIFAKAGMTHTAALDVESVHQGYAQGYAKTPRGQPPEDPIDMTNHLSIVRSAAARQAAIDKGGYTLRNNIYLHVAKGGPAGGTFSTAADLLKFVNAFSSGRLVDAAMVKQMTTPKPPAAPTWGYGMAILDAGGYGHGGGFFGISTSIDVYPHGYRLIVLSNIDSGAFMAEARLLEIAAATRG